LLIDERIPLKVDSQGLIDADAGMIVRALS
jgi:hypothetical protein